MAAPLMQNERFLKIAMPVAIGVLVIVLWHLLVKGFNVPKYIVPSPALVLETLIQDRELLFSSLMILWEVKNVVDGGETSYISAALGIYISIYNLFTSLLHLLMAFAGDRD